MSSAVVSALIKFSTTLSDDKVDHQSKLRVLGTLNEVSLTLSELSESGVGRAVRKLKNEPGDLGRTAKTLVTKWKSILKDHLVKEALPLPVEPDEELEREFVSCDIPCNVASTPAMKSSISNGMSPKNGITPHESPCVIGHSQLSSEEPKKINKFTDGLIRENRDNSPSTPGHRSDEQSEKRKHPDKLVSVGSSSGLSFMDSLIAGSLVNHKKRKKKQTNAGTSSVVSLPSPSDSSVAAGLCGKASASFTASILSSLAEDVERPDAVNRPASSMPSYRKAFDGTASILDDDADGGDLKFKSKKVLWMPKPGRNHSTSDQLASSNNRADPVNGTNELRNTPARLADICLDVLQRNLSRVDQVGEVPYELLANVLRHADAEDLARIELCNPQFEGCSDELWQRHVQLKFHCRKDAQPQPDESWRDLYDRLLQEQTSKLNKIIHQSAQKIKESLHSRRTTLPTEVITPRQFKPRGGNRFPSILTKTLVNRPSTSGSSNIKATQQLTYQKPYNVSRPSDNRSVTPAVTARPSSACRSFSAVSSAAAAGNHSLMNKLRKQFRSRRLQ